MEEEGDAEKEVKEEEDAEEKAGTLTVRAQLPALDAWALCVLFAFALIGNLRRSCEDFPLRKPTCGRSPER